MEFQKRLFKTQEEEAEALYNQVMGFIVPIPSEEQKQKAFDLLQKAADLGHLEAHVDLYYCYAQGSGPVDDEDLGVQWLTKAAEAGLVRAQAVLGAHWGQKWFETDEESTREAAYFWTGKAAAQGDFLSAQTLELYTNAHKDTLVKEFLQTLHQASLGDPSAQQTTSLMYQAGIGVAQDQEKADYWTAKFEEQKPAYIEMLKQKAAQGDGRAGCELLSLTTPSLGDPDYLVQITANIEKMKIEDPEAYERLTERAAKIPDFGK
ncbi:MAG: tetratricopeptide repeat protein [Terrimicrobiaceae bacterium]